MDITYSESAKDLFLLWKICSFSHLRNVCVAPCPNCEHFQKNGGFWVSGLQFAESLFWIMSFLQVDIHESGVHAHMPYIWNRGIHSEFWWPRDVYVNLCPSQAQAGVLRFMLMNQEGEFSLSPSNRIEPAEQAKWGNLDKERLAKTKWISASF